MGEKQGFSKMGLSSSSGGEDREQKEASRQPAYKRRRVWCGVCVAVLVVALGVVATALSQTVFKFRDPKVSLHDVALQNVSLNLDLASLSTLLSVSVSADVRVENPNYYEFRYRNSTVVLVYHGDRVGVVELGAGTIRSRRTVDLPAVVTIQALALVLNGLQDIAGGVASLTMDAVIPGRVNVANLFKRHVTATLNCSVDIFLANQTLKQNSCKQTIKL